MDEKAYYTESPTTKPMSLNCPFCRSAETYDLRWMVRKKKDRLPPGGRRSFFLRTIQRKS